MIYIVRVSWILNLLNLQSYNSCNIVISVYVFKLTCLHNGTLNDDDKSTL